MPTRDPDDGEIDNVDEFLNTIGAVEHDEALISLLGEGYDLNVPSSDVDQDIADMLSTWRDEINREPIRDTATGREHPAGGEWPPTLTGGNMSVEDKAGALRNIPLPFAMIQQAMQELNNALNTASMLLGSSGTGLGRINAAVQNAKQQIDNAYEATHQVEATIGEVAAEHMRG